ncbi:4-amino-4-deoxy-L-arabinose-phosphoundecaprenol flippase subunit ArnE [Candidatus Thermoflexus japonica]|uniref:4-amino-4-deoxy-L-arabinose-phosphoundecaprenol flippase subunit ArnE n=1 Tax=Candidatus Thermoflexus japonica TaxID=2035417 RepID=A0A2H5Y3E2_9CHLR|nr:4-amino-4-deoxy-L-arabinose-phosphoundecaprenol flippase subunit ArnE [Candidatus Thermoflexus japonica]
MKGALVYLLVSIACAVVGQVLLKQGMRVAGPVTLSLYGLPHLILQLATNPWVVVGMSLYLGGSLFWLTALSRLDLSLAYPFAGLNYVLILLASYFVFGEALNPTRIAGALLIALGVSLIARSA